MKRALALVAALAVGALVPSTPVSADAPRPLADALVRVAHFSPDTAGVDVWVDGKRVLQNVGYDTVSDYVPLPAGDHQFALRPFGASSTSKPVLSASAALAPNIAYTIAGVGLNRELRGQIFQDNLGAPPAGSAKVRVIDAAVGTAPIDVAWRAEPRSTTSASPRPRPTRQSHRRPTAGPHLRERQARSSTCRVSSSARGSSTRSQ